MATVWNEFYEHWKSVIILECWANEEEEKGNMEKCKKIKKAAHKARLRKLKFD